MSEEGVHEDRGFKMSPQTRGQYQDPLVCGGLCLPQPHLDLIRTLGGRCCFLFYRGKKPNSEGLSKFPDTINLNKHLSGDSSLVFV